MKKILFVAAALICISACCQKTRTIGGKVIDAAMNSIILATDAGEFCVSTAFADPSEVEGVLIGDVVEVEYTEVKSGSATINSVRSLSVVSPSYYRLIAGTWLTGCGDESCGFTLAEDGTATGSGARWAGICNYVLDGEELALIQKSGDRNVSTVFDVVRLDADSLVVATPAGEQFALARKQVRN